MTKVTVKVISDTISKTGRHIQLSLINTDNSVLNDYLSLPININKTYDNSTSLQKIRKDMKQEIKSITTTIKKQIQKHY